MTTFTNGQTASLTLDVQDTLTISGSARLEITEAFTPKFETTVSGGTQTMGPFGAVTQVIIHGTGNGSFTQQPSNNSAPVSVVDMTSAQIAAPTAAQLAATNILYQLNAPPYTIYQSSGTALVPFGSAGAFSTLSDAATANIPVANIPLSNALAALQAKLVSGTSLKTINSQSLLGSGDLVVAGGSSAPTLVTYSTTIPLDGNKYSAQHTLTSAETITIGATAEGGSYYVEYVPNGYTPTFSGSLARSGTWNPNHFMQANLGYQNSRAQVILYDTGIPLLPVFTAQSAPVGSIGVAYSYTFVATGATSYSLGSGTLPAGLSFSGAGVLSGTPTTNATYTFVISATNSTGSTSSTGQSVVISGSAPSFTAQSAVAGTVGAAYSYTFVASNINASSAYAVASGTLPAGLSLNTTTGVLSGTPTFANTYSFVISATGPAGTTNSTSQSVTIAVSAPVFSAQSAPAGNVGTAYSYTFVASNVNATAGYAVASGGIPAGLSLNTTTGVLSGTPTTAATYTFVISAAGPSGTTNSTSQSVVIGVAATGSLTAASVTNTSTDLTASAYLDYYVINASFPQVNDFQNCRKSDVNLIGVPSLFNATDNSTYGGSPAILSWTDGTQAAGNNSGVARSFAVSSAAPGGFQFTVPAAVASRRCRVWVGDVAYASGRYTTVRAVLSDSSATQQTVVFDGATGGGSNAFGCAEFTYNAASNGQHLTVTVEGDPFATAQAALFGMAYY